MIKEIFYTKDTLYIFLEKIISKRTIKILQTRLQYITCEYNIQNIIIDIKEVTKFDHSFYRLLENYPIKIKGDLKIENR